MEHVINSRFSSKCGLDFDALQVFWADDEEEEASINLIAGDHVAARRDEYTVYYAAEQLSNTLLTVLDGIVTYSDMDGWDKYGQRGRDAVVLLVFLCEGKTLQHVVDALVKHFNIDTQQA
jgi:hypothetical protein